MDKVGIRATGRYVPKHFILTKDIIKKEGLTDKEVKSIATNRVFEARDEEPTDMAVKAANKTIQKANISPGDIDVLVYSATNSDYIRWADAARIQYDIGAENCYAFRMEQGCCGSMAGIDYAYSRLKTDKDITNILVVCGDKFSKPVFNKWKSASANYYSDGASAALISRKNIKFDILGSYSITDGSFNRLWKIPVGGLVEPATERNVQAGQYVLDCKKTAREYLSYDEKREELYNILVKNNKKVMLELFNRLNCSIDDVDKVVLYNVGKHVLDKIISILNIEESKTSTYISYEHGHMGPVDILFNLDKMVEDNKFDVNDKVLLFSAGYGFSWATSLLEYRGN
ncbi:3-oxoacyl-ACP synthase III family protein [Maledivibacter halophilus]|uniref:3-oxoacyl-[acyl-carrier-protein] synthase-3 n=1 Tax=Maledivibacter halophilus TaxID=36842 RepID=A0A1T5LK86_9FIRM|nr:3-oxoacyl-[acyl-carrier-protein] synthase III C-terminal domain-containing protein [Maledivibacter halophilus]SKC76380.1 3-oxoacyl-[acyl-carrier-protein] synthase-3 [Maledivibacter halophilus]